MLGSVFKPLIWDTCTIPTSTYTPTFQLDRRIKMPATKEKQPTIYQLASESAKYLQSVVPEELRAPRVGIICGSGLGGLVETLEAAPQIAIPYSDIPEFPQSTGNSPINIYSKTC
jgi:hypothetical protein